jgi:tryptophanyl-tRNA synthetase
MELTDPTSKMSGSNSPEAGLVLLSDDPKRIVKKIKSAVTDAERRDPLRPGAQARGVQPAGHPVGAHRGADPTLEAGYAGRGYGDLKGQVAEVTVAALAPFQQRMQELLDDPAELDRILASGAERAGSVSAATMERVKDRIGLLPRAR